MWSSPWPAAIRRSRSTPTSLESLGGGTSFGNRTTSQSAPLWSGGPRPRNGSPGTSPSSRTAAPYAKLGIPGAPSAPCDAIAIGISANALESSGRAEFRGAQRQRIKSAVRLAREGALGGIGLGLCSADEAPHRCAPTARVRGRLHRYERRRG